MMHRRYFVRDREPALDLFLNEIRPSALLSAEQERQLARAISGGDGLARGRMIEANLLLVVKLAAEYRGRGMSLDDLVGEGILGLIRAVQDFNPEVGARFSTYASHWIRQSILAALTNTASVIRLPAHMVGLIGRWKRIERVLQRELGRDPSFQEIADTLKLTVVQREMVRSALATRNLARDGQRGNDDETPWSCAETADPRDSHEVSCQASEERREVLKRLGRLDERERMVICLRFGLNGGTPLTLQEIGTRLGVTREWVRKIERVALQQLGDNPPPRAKTRARRRPKPERTERGAGLAKTA